ncbi:MAG: hypothetical protein NUV67_06330 [archaeon]|nr:hypothetical protein [archaeon]
MIEILAVLLFAGGLAKLADIFSDDEEQENLWGIAAAIPYGILLGYVMSVDAIVGTIFLGVVAGVALTGKFDSISHLSALAAIILTLTFFGSFLPALAISAVIFATSVLDEILNDYVNGLKKRGEKASSPVRIISEYRLLTEFAGIGFFAITGNALYWLAILAFDAGYIAIDFLGKKIGKIAP